MKKIQQNELTSSLVATHWIALSPLIVIIFAIISYLTTGDSSTFGLLSNHTYFYLASFILLFLCFDLYPIIIKERRFMRFKTTIKTRPELFILLGFFVWNTIATLLQIGIFGKSDALASVIAPLGIQEGFLIFFVYAMCVFFAFGIKNKAVMERILYIFLISATTISILALLDPNGNWIIQSTHNTPWASLFINSNHYGYFLTLATTLSAGILVFAKEKWKQITFAVLTLFFCLISMFVDTFGSLIATFIIFLALPFILWLTKKRFMAKSLLPIGLFVLSSFVAILFANTLNSTYKSFFTQIINLVKEIFTIFEAPSSDEAMSAGTNRWSLWLNAIKSILANPLIGNGDVLMRPHNEYLQYAVVWGIPSVIIYLSAFVVIAIKFIKHHKKLSNLSIILSLCVLCYLISAIFGNTMPHVVPFFALFLVFLIIKLNDDITTPQETELAETKTEKL